jgi:hypothetical protein
VFLALKNEINKNPDRSFEIRCWKTKENIGWIDRVKNGVLQAVKEERNIAHTMKRRKADSIGRILRRNCLLQHITEGKVEGGQLSLEGVEEDVSSYLVTLSKREDIGT